MMFLRIKNIKNYSSKKKLAHHVPVHGTVSGLSILANFFGTLARVFFFKKKDSINCKYIEKTMFH
jgi:hypothetical protein